MLTSSPMYHVFSHPMTPPSDRLESVGRAFMLRAVEPLSSESMLCRTSATEITKKARNEHSRVVVLDTYPCEYADSDGLRWLLSLQSELRSIGIPLHIVARPNSRVRRNFDLLRADLTVYNTVQDALHITI